MKKNILEYDALKTAFPVIYFSFFFYFATRLVAKPETGRKAEHERFETVIIMYHLHIN